MNQLYYCNNCVTFFFLENGNMRKYKKKTFHQHKQRCLSNFLTEQPQLNLLF